MRIGRIILKWYSAPPWNEKLRVWVEDRNTPLFSDYVDEMPFWAARAGENRIARVTKMFQMGFISPAEARAMLGGLS
jgi:hypothetical protein